MSQPTIAFERATRTHNSKGQAIIATPGVSIIVERDGKALAIFLEVDQLLGMAATAITMARSCEGLETVTEFEEKP